MAGRTRAQLEGALEEDVQRTTVAEQAARAQVGNQTILSVIKGDFHVWKPPRDHPAAMQSKRWREGRARSLIRIALSRNEAPQEWLDAFGFDASSSTIENELRRFYDVDGVSLTAITVQRGAVRAILTDFGQFADAPRAGEEASRSFLAEYFTALIGAVDPSWKVNVRVSGKVDEVIEEWGSGQYQALLGLIASPLRLKEGVDCLRIPGWRMPLGLVASSEVAGETSWFDFVNAPRDSSETPTPIVISRTVAAEFVLGPCRYREEDCEIVADHSAEAVLDALERRNGSGPSKPIFVGDSIIVDRVLARAGDHFVAVKEGEGFAPSYEIGIGVRSTDPTWKERLQRVQDEELFGSSAIVGATIYARFKQWMAAKNPEWLKRHFKWQHIRQYPQFHEVLKTRLRELSLPLYED